MAGMHPSTPARRFRDLMADLETVEFVGHGDPEISLVEYDSRLMAPGALFIALRGSDFDGHAFASRAVAAGAVAILAEEPLPLDVPQAIVPDSRAALATVAARFFDYPSRDLKVVGITGTDGKTTTSYILEHILQHAGVVTGVIGTVGVRIGREKSYDNGHQTTPESNRVQKYLREMADDGVEVAIVESTSHGLAMHRLDGVQYGYAGVTNITREHLEYHGTIERYRSAKAILIERTVRNHGVVVLNAEDEGARAMLGWTGDHPVMWYSAESARSSNVVARNIIHGQTSISFQMRLPDAETDVELPMIGQFNVANALLAASLAHALGLETATIAEALGKPLAIPGRLHQIDQGQPFAVVVDYAHTPESLRKILMLLRDRYPSNRVLVVTGSAGQRDEGKRPIQGAVCAELADVSIFTNEDPRLEDADKIIQDIAEGARGIGTVEGERFHCLTDRRAAIALAFDLAAPGDCVLLAGKGHETSIIVGLEHVPWNEAQVASDLLAERGYPGDE
ncbi:MAG: UDP-N-acetylmuramoyl-L-alanyl-D-glutamate--2,6-diaminopimelate ligase [Thermomicrobiales bacterium]